MNTFLAELRPERMCPFRIERPSRRRPSCLLVLFLAGAVAGRLRAGDKQLPAYRWEAEQIYRYRFHKRAETTNPETQKTRVTDCRCILVIEVESVDAAAKATARIRYLTPRLLLPLPVFAPEATQERTEEQMREFLARGVRSVLRQTRWPVTLSPDGAIRLREKPTNWRNWMRSAEQAGHWPKRVGNEVAKLLDEHFNIGEEQTSDDEWLPVLRDELPGKRVKGLRAFRPRRRIELVRTGSDGFATLRLRRDPEAQPPPVQVPLLDAKDVAVTLSRGAVKTQFGEAVFDAKLGLLDSARERYQVALVSRCSGLTQRADVVVSYELKRLEPPLRVKATDAEGASESAGAGAPRNAP